MRAYATTDKDACRFCALNLAAPMLLRPNKLYVTKAHMFFQDSAFKDGKEWLDKDKVSKWDKRVNFSFQ